jgi:DNA polymerase-3 subunit epsilon
MREIALDTETTGFEPSEGHRMVEIGCVEMVNRVRTGKSYHVYLNPERDMPEAAYKVHGLSSDFLRDKPLFGAVVDEFLAFLGDAPLVIHNAAFDMKFINAELSRVKRISLSFDRTIDTVKIAREKFPGSPANLDALCRRYEIDLSARTKHGALLDAELLADVYLELLGGRQDRLALEPNRAGKNKGEAGAQDGRPDYQKLYPEPRTFAPNKEELEAHQAFVAGMKGAIWEEA